jgi:hypothetical protein
MWYMTWATGGCSSHRTGTMLTLIMMLLMVTVRRLLHAREVVLIGSGMGVGRLTAVDGMAISPGAVLAIEEAPTGGARSPGGHHHQLPSAARESLFELLSKCLDRARARGWSNLWTVSEVPGL